MRGTSTFTKSIAVISQGSAAGARKKDGRLTGLQKQ
jgi:hypothetical protein